MQTAFQSTEFVAPLRAFPRLHQMQPGRLFHPLNDGSTVYALLSHDQLGVMDGKRIWCVVVAAKDAAVTHVGSLVPLERDAQVEVLLVESPMRLVAVR